MSELNCEKMKMIAQLEVRESFDHYLTEIFPEQLERIIAAHNKDVTAHSTQIRIAVRAESARVKLWLYGLIFVGGIGGGIGLRQVIAAFVS